LGTFICPLLVPFGVFLVCLDFRFLSELSEANTVLLAQTSKGRIVTELNFMMNAVKKRVFCFYGMAEGQLFLIADFAVSRLKEG
jgi:hypothetical protein